MPLATYQAPTRRYSYAPAAPGVPQQPQTGYYSSLAPSSGGGGGAPSPYPAAAPTFFQPRQQPTLAPGRPNPRQTLQYERQKALAGPLAGILPFGPQRPITAGDVPLFEAGLNFEQLLMAERDRARGFDELSRARGAIGSSPESNEARQTALMMARGEIGPFTNDIIEKNLGNIRNQGALGFQGARRSAEESMASRGLGGGLLASQLANLEQQSAADIMGQLTGFETQARQGQFDARRQALAQLSEITGREESQRAALDQALANIFLETERAPISLSGLVPVIQKGTRRLKPKYAI